MIRVDQTMIGRVGLIEHREALRVRLPGKPAAVDDRATERGAMPAHELRQRMDDDVGAVFDRTQQDRRRDGVVDDHRDAMPRCNRRQSLNVADVSRRIADAFAEYRARAAVNQPFDGVGLIGLGKSNGDALAWQDVGEQRVRRAIELGNGDDIAPHLREIEYCVIQGGLASADAQCLEPALERSHPPLKDRCRRIADARITEALDFEIE